MTAVSGKSESLNSRRNKIGEGGTFDATFSNGSLAAVGIVVGSSLAFIIGWANNSLPRQWNDAFAMVPLLVGTLIQMKSLMELLNPSALREARYLSAKNHFLLGFSITAIGAAAAIVRGILRSAQPE
jgi:hypothetical protein